MSIKKNIEFHRGETWEIRFVAHNADKTVMNLTGANVFFRLSKGQTELLTKSVGVGVTITNPVAGEGTVIITKADQDAVTIGEEKSYNYELKVDLGATVSVQAYGELKSKSSLFYP